MPARRPQSPVRLALLLAAVTLLLAADRLPALPGPPSPAAAATGPSEAPPGLPVGIRARLPERSGEDLRRVVSTLRRAGVSHVRENVSWGKIEPLPGVFRWEETDRWVAAAARGRLEIIALVGGPPGWATSAWNVAPVRGAPLADFSRFVRRLVARYGSTGSFWRVNPNLPRVPITLYDIWNEPWVSRFWSRDFPDPAGYARMFKAVVQAARPADPRSRFLLEADTRVIETGWPWRPFLSAMFDAVPDLGKYADGVSVHPYQGDGGSPRACSRPEPSRGIERDWRTTVSEFCRLTDIRRILDSRGAGATGIWVTEIGWSTSRAERSGVSEAEQADRVAEVFELLRADAGLVEGVAWYEYQGPEADPARADQFLGLVRPDGTPKPAWRAFAAEARREARQRSD